MEIQKQQKEREQFEKNFTVSYLPFTFINEKRNGLFSHHMKANTGGSRSQLPTLFMNHDLKKYGTGSPQV